jgi:hypothetical protein
MAEMLSEQIRNKNNSKTWRGFSVSKTAMKAAPMCLTFWMSLS